MQCLRIRRDVSDLEGEDDGAFSEERGIWKAGEGTVVRASHQLPTHSQVGSTHTFSFSPGPHLLPMIRRSTTGPRSRSKLQTTISLIHLPILSAVEEATKGGGRGSPGRRCHPSLVLGYGSTAELGVLFLPEPEGPGCDASCEERSYEGTRTCRFNERERPTVFPLEVRRAIGRVGIRLEEDGVAWSGERGSAEEGRTGSCMPQKDPPASGVSISLSSVSAMIT